MNNPYSPPSSMLSSVRSRHRYIGHIFRLVILAFCSVQFLTLAYHIMQAWSSLPDAFARGVFSPAGLIASVFFSFILMVGGVLLLFLRKAAIWLFAIYLPYQIYWLVASQNQSTLLQALFSLICLIGFIFYSVWLKSAGRLT